MATIPKRWLPFVKACAEQLAPGARQWGPAQVLMVAHDKSEASKSVKAAPRKAREKADSLNAIARRVALRREVFARAVNRCDCCGSHTPSELHHLVSGPNRRTRGSVETCAAVCQSCHIDLHRSREPALRSMRGWALNHGFTEAAAALTRRIDKLETTP